jgi:hypothetical protein
MIAFASSISSIVNVKGCEMKLAFLQKSKATNIMGSTVRPDLFYLLVYGSADVKFPDFGK